MHSTRPCRHPYQLRFELPHRDTLQPFYESGFSRQVTTILSPMRLRASSWNLQDPFHGMKVERGGKRGECRGESVERRRRERKVRGKEIRGERVNM